MNLHSFYEHKNRVSPVPTNSYKTAALPSHEAPVRWMAQHSTTAATLLNTGRGLEGVNTLLHDEALTSSP